MVGSPNLLNALLCVKKRDIKYNLRRLQKYEELKSINKYSDILLTNLYAKWCNLFNEINLLCDFYSFKSYLSNNIDNLFKCFIIKFRKFDLKNII